MVSAGKRNVPVTSCEFHGSVEAVVWDLEQSVKRPVYTIQPKAFGNLIYGTETRASILGVRC